MTARVLLLAAYALAMTIAGCSPSNTGTTHEQQIVTALNNISDGIWWLSLWVFCLLFKDMGKGDK